MRKRLEEEIGDGKSLLKVGRVRLPLAQAMSFQR